MGKQGQVPWQDRHRHDGSRGGIKSEGHRAQDERLVQRQHLARALVALRRIQRCLQLVTPGQCGGCLLAAAFLSGGQERLLALRHRHLQPTSPRCSPAAESWDHGQSEEAHAWNKTSP